MYRLYAYAENNQGSKGKNWVDYLGKKLFKSDFIGNKEVN